MDLPLLSPEFRHWAFDALHALSHPCIRGSCCLLASRFLWPGMNKDVGAWASSCLDCRRTKVARHVHPPVHCIDVPSRCFFHIHVHLVGPLPSVRGYTHVFSVVDRSTCWPAAYPIQDTATTACIALVEWISSFRVPATVTSDRGSQFTSSSWSAFCHSLGIMTTAYQPQSNGMVERIHRRLKAALVAHHSSGRRSCLGSSSASGACLWSSLAFLPLSWCLAHRQPSLDNSCWRPSSRRRSFSTTSTTSWIPSFCFWCTVHRLPPSGPMHLPLALWQAEYVFIC